MTYDAPLQIHEEAVQPDWIDYNGHMNVAYYVLAFDHATDAWFDLLGIGLEYVEATNCSIFQVECHVNYFQEVTAGAALRFELQLLDFDDKRMHYLSRMYHRDEGFLSATCEWMAVHVDLAARRSAPMPAATISRLQDIHEAHAGLERPEQACARIGIVRKA
ncbi:MAG: thioesterase family protein [Alphaproteobacteria bacterium]|jgi:acyl-CoA thioester hydrolase|nr:thioesterase family protein [Alphaproteobacteria bacterium]MDP6624645.1 thioesterase family protein [Alphaproteobacteria bacterium]|tara:strand:+ start:310 stop:795 length:486 start_codon:yes stop_codon:yes gene_type:complete